MSMIVARTTTSSTQSTLSVRPRQPRPEVAAAQVRANTQSLAAGSVAGSPVRGQQAACQDSRYLNHDHDPSTFRIQTSAGQTASVTGLHAVGSEAKFRYQDDSGTVHNAKVGPKIAQEVEQRDQLLGQLKTKMATALESGVITVADQKQLDGMLDSVRQMQAGIRHDVGNAIGRLEQAQSGVSPAPTHTAGAPAQQAASTPVTHTASEPASAPATHTASKPASAPATHTASKPAGAPATHTASAPATHTASAPATHTASAPAHHSSTAHASSSTHSTSSAHASSGAQRTESSSAAASDLRLRLDLIANSSNPGDSAQGLVHNHPELLKGATTAQLSRLASYMCAGDVSDTDRSGLMKLFEGRSPDQIAAIIQGAGATDAQGTVMNGPEAVASAFIHQHPQDNQFAAFMEKKGLSGQNSPFRDYFLHKVGLAVTRDGDQIFAAGGYVSIGGINSEYSGGYAKMLSDSPLLLSAAGPAEKGQLLASLAAKNWLHRGYAEAKARILESLGSKAAFDEAMNRCDQLGIGRSQIQEGLRTPIGDVRARLG
jgi:hypothetical protein